MKGRRDTRGESVLYTLAVGYERWARRRGSAPARVPALVFGAGAAAAALLHSMVFDPDSPFEPLGILDDDPARQGERLAGIPVIGTRRDLDEAVAGTGAEVVIFAVGNAEAGLIRDVRERAVAAGVRLLIVPEASEALDHELGAADVREVQITDLLGRHRIEAALPEAALAELLTGRRVLVTGAGGQIGSELCRQIHRYEPAALTMLDHDEAALQTAQLAVDPRAGLHDRSVQLADIRDAARVREVFRTGKPEVVFHAAALKHQPLLERHPAEAVKTNVLGALNVLEAAGDAALFVNVSTDKAADPVSVLGYTERVAERLTAHHGGLSVRFGNVLGSRGSVVATFAAQIADGGPITVTHPDATRYLMTAQEAVNLTLRAATLGRPGEALILQLGEPVLIAELARQMIALAGRPVDIVFTGLRPGEKLGDVLFGAGENPTRPHHPLISHVAVPPLHPAAVRPLTAPGIPEALTSALAGLCGPALSSAPLSGS
ncbi:polysaccharide biosynthesis protein [Paractinoplanes brasiliensis]|uniref:polysaccharide biosynthesis protein n=1 Tax=Paractinoplanes brasiliensis TaxID=52695 RepID=UPI001A5CD130|nr:polysaccharide biosynthesis protein [Actinoplanes brasiliensis]GID28369.1 dTDP-glucose 4,6-dehydratase [Actinoplanes brasiliensis]